MMIPKIIMIPVLVGLATQLLKIVPRMLQGKKAFDAFWNYGGMPSGHTAIVISLATMVGREVGFSSTVFAIVVVFAILIIRDAIGFRRLLGAQSRAINILNQKFENHESSLLKERLGHTLGEVAVGALIGVLLTLAFDVSWF